MWGSAWLSHQVLIPRAGSSRRCSQARQMLSMRIRASGWRRDDTAAGAARWLLCFHNDPAPAIVQHSGGDDAVVGAG
jgi:hypothetical protein